jgi:hypothetical protein
VTLALDSLLQLFYSVGIKIDKITRIFYKVEDIKNRGHLLGRKEWADSYPDNQQLKNRSKRPVFVAGQLSGQRVVYNFRPNK